MLTIHGKDETITADLVNEGLIDRDFSRKAPETGR